MDISQIECKRILRVLELKAYRSVVDALRAQGSLTSNKHEVLKNLAVALKVSDERYRSEIRRAVNDDLLNTIASCTTKKNTKEGWQKESIRRIPLTPMIAPNTAFTVLADSVSDLVAAENEKFEQSVNSSPNGVLNTFKNRGERNFASYNSSKSLDSLLRKRQFRYREAIFDELDRIKQNNCPYSSSAFVSTENSNENYDDSPPIPELPQGVEVVHNVVAEPSPSSSLPPPPPPTPPPPPPPPSPPPPPQRRVILTDSWKSNPSRLISELNELTRKSEQHRNMVNDRYKPNELILIENPVEKETPPLAAPSLSPPPPPPRNHTSWNLRVKPYTKYSIDKVEIREYVKETTATATTTTSNNGVPAPLSLAKTSKEKPPSAARRRKVVTESDTNVVKGSIASYGLREVDSKEPFVEPGGAPVVANAAATATTTTTTITTTTFQNSPSKLKSNKVGKRRRKRGGSASSRMRRRSMQGGFRRRRKLNIGQQQPILSSPSPPQPQPAGPIPPDDTPLPPTDNGIVDMNYENDSEGNIVYHQFDDEFKDLKSKRDKRDRRKERKSVSFEVDTTVVKIEPGTKVTAATDNAVEISHSSSMTTITKKVSRRGSRAVVVDLDGASTFSQDVNDVKPHTFNLIPASRRLKMLRKRSLSPASSDAPPAKMSTFDKGILSHADLTPNEVSTLEKVLKVEENLEDFKSCDLNELQENVKELKKITEKICLVPTLEFRNYPKLLSIFKTMNETLTDTAVRVGGSSSEEGNNDAYNSGAETATGLDSSDSETDKVASEEINTPETSDDEEVVTLDDDDKEEYVTLDTNKNPAASPASANGSEEAAHSMVKSEERVNLDEKYVVSKKKKEKKNVEPVEVKIEDTNDNASPSNVVKDDDDDDDVSQDTAEPDDCFIVEENRSDDEIIEVNIDDEEDDEEVEAMSGARAVDLDEKSNEEIINLTFDDVEMNTMVEEVGVASSDSQQTDGGSDGNKNGDSVSEEGSKLCNDVDKVVAEAGFEQCVDAEEKSSRVEVGTTKEAKKANDLRPRTICLIPTKPLSGDDATESTKTNFVILNMEKGSTLTPLGKLLHAAGDKRSSIHEANIVRKVKLKSKSKQSSSSFSCSSSGKPATSEFRYISDADDPCVKKSILLSRKIDDKTTSSTYSSSAAMATATTTTTTTTAKLPISKLGGVSKFVKIAPKMSSTSSSSLPVNITKLNSDECALINANSPFSELSVNCDPSNGEEFPLPPLVWLQSATLGSKSLLKTSTASSSSSLLNNSVAATSSKKLPVSSMKNVKVTPISGLSKSQPITRLKQAIAVSAAAATELESSFLPASAKEINCGEVIKDPKRLVLFHAIQKSIKQTMESTLKSKERNPVSESCSEMDESTNSSLIEISSVNTPDFEIADDSLPGGGKTANSFNVNATSSNRRASKLKRFFSELKEY